MHKNTAIVVTIVAWDTILNAGKTGLTDITLRGVGDGAEYTPAAAATQVDAVNLPGVYSVSLIAAENNYNSNLIGGKSATANISIIPISWINESEDFNATKKTSITTAVPSAATIQSGLALDSTVAKDATVAKASALTTLDGKVDAIDAVVDAIKAKTDTIGGAGAITWTYTLTNSMTGAPIDGAEIWITTDLAGSNVIATGLTNTSGTATFLLDAGPVYVWRKKAGFDFVNPDTEVVS